MNRLPLLITVLVLAALTALLWWVRRPDAPPELDPRVNQPVLAPATVEAAHRISLRAGATTSNLVRTDAGHWAVEEQHALPADFDKLRRLMGDLTGAKVTRFVTGATDRLARLDLDRAKVTLTGADERPLAELLFGRSSTGGGSFIAFNPEGPAYEISANPWIDASPSGWVRKQVLDFTASEVAEIEFQFGGNHPPMVTARSDEHEPWSAKSGGLPNAEFNAEEVDRVLTTFLNARFSEVRGIEEENAAGALAAAEELMRLTLFDGRSYGLRIGRRPAPAAPPPAEEEQPETPAPQPGPVFLFFDLPAGEAVWSEALNRVALEYYEHLYSARPTDPKAFHHLPEETPDVPEAKPVARPAERPGTVSVVTEPIAVPAWTPPTPAQPDPEP